MDWERCIQMVFLLVMFTAETTIFAIYLVAYFWMNSDEIDCHHPAFAVFSGIDVAQIFCTIIAVYFIKRKIHRQHQSVMIPRPPSPDKRSMMIDAKSRL